MRRLFVPVKSGFKITKPELPVVIRDERGLLFYSTEFKAPNVHAFNLPAGTYFVEQGQFGQMANPINYPLMPLPPHERNRPIPKHFKKVWGDKPRAKCQINWDTHTITFDYRLADYTLPEQDFIRFHEYSHAHYQTEKYCDLKAANYMIRKGYNPIQIGASQIDSLSSGQHERKRFLINQLIKTYGKTYQS